MWPRIRKLAIPLLVASFSTAGLAYAQMGETSSEDSARDVTEVESGELIAGGENILELDDEGNEGADPTGSSGTTATGRSTEGCPDGFSGNHGQYVSSTEERPRREAAHSQCGKPLASLHNGDEEGDFGEFEEARVEPEEQHRGKAKGHSKDEPGTRGKGKGHDR